MKAAPSDRSLTPRRLNRRPEADVVVEADHAGEPIASDLRVDQCAVGREGRREKSSIAVPLSFVELQPQPGPNRSRGRQEFRGLGSETLRRPVRMFGFRGVDIQQANSLISALVLDVKSVPVDVTSDHSLGACGIVRARHGNHSRSHHGGSGDTQSNFDQDSEHEFPQPICR